MASINVNSDQSIFDVLLQSSGGISALFDFMNANALTELDISAGVYQTVDVLNPDVVSYLEQNNPSTVLVTPQMASVVPVGYVSNSDASFQIDVPGGDTVELGDYHFVINVNGVEVDDFSHPSMKDLIINIL